MKAIGSYISNGNTNVEYGIREDGAVFTRSTQWSSRFGAFVTSKWKRDQYWETAGTFTGTPESVRIGFASQGPHRFIANTRLRLPKE